MALNFKMMMLAAVLVAPLAFAESKAECERDCDSTVKLCEDTMLKKLGKDNKAAVAQVKKACADAGKQCKQDCGK